MTKHVLRAGPRRSALSRGFAQTVGLSLIAALILAACGAGVSDGNPAEAADHDDTASAEIGSDAGQEDDAAAVADNASPSSGDPILDFYECLRDNDLEVADPIQGQAIGLQGIDLDDPAVMATVQECSQTHLGRSDGRVTVGGDNGQMGDNLADIEALIDFVDCIRDHGFDMPDPSPDGRLSLPAGIDPQSREFQAAINQCAVHLAGGGVLIGESGGGGAVRR